MATWDDVVSIGERLPGDGSAHVLVRLEAIEEGELAELVEDAWRLTAPSRLVAGYEGGQ